MSQHTEGAKHYGVTTEGAKSHVAEMIASGEWADLTGFDRACIAELLADNSARATAMLPRVKDMPATAYTDPQG